MNGKTKRILSRVLAMLLTVISVFQISELAFPAFAAGSYVIQKAEANPFDGLRWSTKPPIDGYNGSYPTDIMKVEIDGVYIHSILSQP